jgi:hypothetical protein
MAETETLIDNPLAENPARDQRIRERAYRLWESDGCPHGRDIEYWERARELVGIEESPRAGELPNPAFGADAARDPGGPIEEASLQENLGEFPGRFTDQGDRQPTPSLATRRAARG